MFNFLEEYREEDGIYGFFEEYRFLSNFWPCDVFLGRLQFPSVENAYQAAKFQRDKMVLFQEISAPQSKQLSRLLPKDLLEDGWEGRKISVMRDLLQQKFSRGDDLTRKLLDTGELYLEETNTWNDKFWGVCRNEGKNVLGKLLMEIRTELRKSGEMVVARVC